MDSDNEGYQATAEKPTSNKENYHETQTAVKMSTYFGFFSQAFRQFIEKKCHSPA